MLSFVAAPPAQFSVLEFLSWRPGDPIVQTIKNGELKNPRAAVFRPSRGGSSELGQMVCANAICRALRHLMQ